MGTYKSIIGSRIKQMRKEKGLTQQELAKLLGLAHKSTIANYEKGYSIPKDEVKIELCKLFCCSFDYLMTITDEREGING